MTGRVEREVISASLRLAGRQPAEVTVQHPGTPEAVITVRIGHCLLYFHSSRTAERFASVWRGAGESAQNLPRARPLRPTATAESTGIAQPSVVIHAAGAPAATAVLVRTADHAGEACLSVQTGHFAVQVLDQDAYLSCLAVFTHALALARDHLTPDGALAPGYSQDLTSPRLAGADADRAAQDLLSPTPEANTHPALQAQHAVTAPSRTAERYGSPHAPAPTAGSLPASKAPRRTPPPPPGRSASR